MIVTLDFETYYDDIYSLAGEKLTALEYITDPRFKVHMLGVAVNNGDPFLLSPDEIPAFISSLRENFVHITAQNAQFDGLILSHHYGYVAQVYHDTRAMAKALWPHESSSLKHVAERVWPDDPTMRKGDELVQSKGLRDLPPDVYETVGAYCLQDVRLTRALFERLMGMGFPPGELAIVNMVTQWCVDPTLELDFELLERYIPKLEQDRRRLVAASGLWRYAMTYAPDSKNRAQFERDFARELRAGRVTAEDREFFLAAKVLNSNKAFPDYLRSVGIAPPTKVSPKGKPTYALAQNDPEFIALMNANPRLKPVWEARAAVKSTQGLSRATRFVQTATAFHGKMPVPVQYNQAHTGRLGGAAKLNMQNLERNADKTHPDGDLRPGVLRRALLAPEGHRVVVGDLSNIEARLLAYLADHHELVRIFADNGDPYAWMASKIYHRPINKKTDPFERNVGKVAVLSLGYGAGDVRFKHMLNSGPMGMDPIHFDDPQMYARIVATYRRDNAPIVSLWAMGNTWIRAMYDLKEGEHLEHKMIRIERGRIRLPSGLHLHYPNLRMEQSGWVYDSREEGTATKLYGAKLIENITQAVANCVMKEAMRRAYHAMRGLGGKTVLQVHDELVCVAPEDRAEEALTRLLACLTAVPTWAPGLPVAAEGGYAKNYVK